MAKRAMLEARVAAAWKAESSVRADRILLAALSRAERAAYDSATDRAIQNGGKGSLRRDFKRIDLHFARAFDKRMAKKRRGKRKASA